MSDHLPVLKVRLFGGFSASYGEIPVSFGRNTTTKAMKLLQILLYHGDTGISRDKLLDELYGREELADAANNLRVTAHRLKKIIVDAGLPSHDYINIKKGIYRWDAPMPTEVDAHQFKVLSKDVQTCTDKVKKLALLKGQMKTDMNKKQKNTRTFLIKIMDQQNGTWQGSVTWVEEQREQHFRSALELLKLIDGALDNNYEVRIEE